MKSEQFFFFYIFFVFLSCGKDEPEVITVIEPYVSEPLSTENLITSFNLILNGEEQLGTIDQSIRLISFETAGADIKALSPKIEYSDKATISPSPDVEQNFEEEVAYTVLAENGEPNVYRVNVNNRPLSDANEILSFKITLNNQVIEANIDDELNEISFNAGSIDISNIVPSIEISEHAIVFPESDIAQDFNNLNKYTVTAENGAQVEYKIVVNKPRITGFSTIVGIFSNNPMLLYTGADMVVHGEFLDIERENSKIYLFDGQNKFPLIITDIQKTDQEFVTFHSLNFQVPSDIPSNPNYKIIYEDNNLTAESEGIIDLVAENVPNPVSLNQTLYQRDDILELTGENLPEMIAIPSNGSLYLIANSGNYDLMVNDDKTLLTLTLDGYFLFPSYYGRVDEEKTIMLLGPNRRAGATIKAIFD
ncbi:DUF5018 domain-containing protein [Flagellimonas eckloniae]|uniref:DUF5018 domain-containing protein n=1 Tax=Flagellimonas eckloniae TaxID=346185 RepID=A0A0Q1BES9_9FLAO|nr:DUF5018 domain-containing protein [Allomuricauda eckloniae]KQC28666.1 hypothetical protein AAY42_01165 [Allomuricauda eckloniae]